jgi:hypothetical protein
MSVEVVFAAVTLARVRCSGDLSRPLYVYLIRTGVRRTLIDDLIAHTTEQTARLASVDLAIQIKRLHDAAFAMLKRCSAYAL